VRGTGTPNQQLQRTLIAMGIALSLGLSVIVILQGFSTSGPIRALETLALVVVGAAALGGGMVAVGSRLAGWTEPESEEEFERIVVRAERLARQGTAAEPEESEFMDLDPYDDEDFEELVADALDELPDLLKPLIENHNVAVVISDGGRRRRAYGLYHGDGATRDEVPDRIVIYRDTLRRDFGHDPELLRAQVTQTVRHELAHHIGFDELGVRDLGL
jgi:predicted Zn-dependent protease with MMP-like domain